MKKTINLMFALMAFGLAGSVAMAATTCALGDNVLTSGFSCSIGSLTFSNFASNTNENPPSIVIQAVGSNGFTLNPNLPTNVNPQLNDIALEFEVSGGVSGVGLSLNGVLGSFVIENVCTSAEGIDPNNTLTFGVCGGTQLASFTAFGNGVAAGATFASTSPIWIFKDINDGQGALSEVNQVYTSGVPEPMTLSMMGAGLLGLSLISRRRKKS